MDYQPGGESFIPGGGPMPREGDEVVDWLLQEDAPSVRYLTLRDLLHRRESDGEVAEARAAIMQAGPVPKLLAKQAEAGHWGRPEDFYVRSKYHGTVWNLILLAEMCADPADERVRKACEFVLDWSQDRESGGFSHVGDGEGGGAHGKVISCLTANMAFSLVRLGYGADPRARKALDWIVRYQRYELRSTAPKEWPYLSDHCWRDHTCRSSVAKALKALAEVPPDGRDGAMIQSIGEAREFFLAQGIFRKGAGSKAVARPEWLHLKFPLMWNTDILEILGLLSRTGDEDERMSEAVDIVMSKRNEQGRWVQESQWGSRLAVRIEPYGAESKWITLKALTMLEALPGLRPPGR